MTERTKKILGRITRYYIVPFTLWAAILFPTANMHQSINGLASILTGLPFMRGDLDFLGLFAIIPGFLASFLPAGFAYLKIPATFGLMEEMLIFYLYVWCAIVRAPRLPDFIQRMYRGKDYYSPADRYPNRFPFWFIGSIALVIVMWGQAKAESNVTVYNVRFIGDVFYKGEKLNKVPALLAMTSRGPEGNIQVKFEYGAIPQEKRIGSLSNAAGIYGFTCMYKPGQKEETKTFISKVHNQDKLVIKMVNPNSDGDRCKKIFFEMSKTGEMQGVLDNGLAYKMNRMDSNDSGLRRRYLNEFQRMLDNIYIETIKIKK